MNGDLYRYFRIEARELIDGLTRGVLELEKGPGDAELVARLLRYAHTLKGAARIVQQPRISEWSHTIEEVLAGIRQRPETMSPGAIRQMLTWIDAIASDLARLEPSAPAQAPTQRGPAADAPDEQFESVRIDMKDLDALLRTVSEVRVQMTGLSRLAPELHGAASSAGDMIEAGAGARLEDTLRTIHRSLSAVLDRSSRELEGLYEQAQAMRLLPADSIFGTLERAARDAAEATGKRVVFEASGGETRLDARGLGLLRNALIHMVRNAVTHGVERPEARVQAGKPPAGRVQIRVERRGDLAVFVCTDDGGGVDLERVRQVVIERRLARPEEAAQLTPAGAMDLLLRGGITTAQKVSQLSGRGVGLDIVREAVAVLNGSLTGQTQAGKGTRIEMSVPVVVESQEVLHVQAGDLVVSIPLLVVRKTLRVKPAEIAVSSEGQTILCDGRAVRFAPLAPLVQNGQTERPGRSRFPPKAAAAGAISALVLESASGMAAVGVTHILGRERVVIRAMPRILGPVPTISGAFLNSEGTPQLVLNPEGLVAAIRSRPGREDRPAPPAPPRLLVIDDSLTTRMLEQGILETAGYAVDTAASGEEALEKARQQPYSLFVVDLEMPGMDGFRFIETARAQPELRSIPSIVVTSRASAEDRARGAAVGAKAYIVKGEFDEKLLLKTISELVG